MRNKFLLVLFTGLTAGITFSSYNSGAGAGGGYDCTGAESGLQNPTGCRSCHGNTAASTIGVTIELDSAGTPVTSYYSGVNYTVKLSGINNGSTSLPRFGFQMTCVKGATSAVTPTNAGTWATNGLPANTRYSAASAGNYVVNMVEQSTRILATTGTGGSGTTYVESFSWTAPAAGTGVISFFAVLNAVNNNGQDDSNDKWNTAHLVINEAGGGPAPSIEFSSTTNSFNENAGTIQIPVQVTNFGSSAVGVTATFTGGSAAVGTDFTCSTTQTLNFSTGTAQNISITITDDLLLESNETFTVTLSNPSGGAALGANTTFTGTIIDNEFNGIAPIAATQPVLSALSNPISSNCLLACKGMDAGSYQLSVYGVNGAIITTKTIMINGTEAQLTLDAATWTSGIYMAVLSRNDFRTSVRLVKE